MIAQSKMIRGVAAIAAAASAVVIPAAAEAGSIGTNLSVTATVSDSCTVSSTPVAFSTVNPISGSAATATGTVSVTCTNGTGWGASAGLGTGTGATFSSRKMKSGTNLLNYNLFTDAAYSTVWGDGTSSTAKVSNTGSGTAQVFNVYGQVPSGQTSVVTGDYTDVVSVTISY